MAQVVNCIICKHNKFGEKCDYYDHIPKDIFVEERKCEHYEKKLADYIDDDLPIAHGR